MKELKIMHAKKFEADKVQVSGSFTLTAKIDGYRCIMEIENSGEIKCYTRQGNEVTGLSEILEEAKHLPKGFMYDGELIAHSWSFRDTAKILQSPGLKMGLTFFVFDSVPLEIHRLGTYGVPYSERYQDTAERLAELEGVKRKYGLFGRKSQQIKVIAMVPKLYLGTDKNQIPAILDETLKNPGVDGIMLNLDHGFYTAGRSNSLFKIKKRYTMDLPYVGCYVACGEARAETVLVEFNGVKVGVRGLSKEDGAYIWENRQNLYGTLIEVAYSDITPKGSLRHPTFNRIRHDKKEASYD